ncbi:MAG: succinylglutamate desuccinylase/aspartoacylase family protein [Planctomycetota bacterium]
MAVQCTVETVTAHLSSGEATIPYWSLTADGDGPTLLVTAALHGNEVQGAEVIRRLRDVAAREMTRGRLLLAPMANLPAVRNRRPHITSGPETPYSVAFGYNINRTWPGDPEGTDSARVARALHPALVEPADFALDFHCWPKMRATTALVNHAYPEAVQWARLTCVRFALGRARPPQPADAAPGDTLIRHMHRRDRRGICVELSGQYLLREREVVRGLRAATNIACTLGLLPGEAEGLDEPMVWLPDAPREQLRAAHDGLFAPVGLRPGDRVEAGQVLGHLVSDRDLAVTELRAPISGYLWTYGRYRDHVDVSLAAQHPFADEGDILAEIAEANEPPTNTSPKAPTPC